MTSLALIGPGRHGTVLAQLFASHGVDVVLHHHRPAKAEAARAAVAAVAVDAQVTVAPTLQEAIADQEVIALTTLWDAPQREVISALGEDLVGRILLDVSNPLDVTPAGIIPRRPQEGSAGQFVAGLLPEGAGHAKTFSHLATAFLREGADQQPPAVLPFVADSAATAERIRPLLAATGWLPWLVGGISRSADLEIGGRFNTVQGRYGRARMDEAQMREFVGGEPA